MKMGTSADAEMLAIYCEACSTWHKARAEVAKYGLTIETPTTTKVNPAYAVGKQAEQTMTRILSAFGMSPVSRTALHVPYEPEENPLRDFADGP